MRTFGAALISFLICVLPVRAEAQPAALRARMDAFVTALREQEPMERIAGFFPRQTAWEFVNTPGSDPRARLSRQRFTPQQTLAAIREGGEVCDSFGGAGGDVGPSEGALVSQAMMKQGRWRYAGRERFVPPGAGVRSPIYVEWLRENGRWVIVRVSEEAHYSPKLLGTPAEDVITRDTTAGVGLPIEQRSALRTGWYQSHWMLSFASSRYVKYGLPRTLPGEHLERFGSIGLVPVFVERGVADPAGNFFILTAPGEYQTYERFGHSICRE